MSRIVLKLSGYIIDEFLLNNQSRLLKILEFIKEDSLREGRKYAIVVGGGSHARKVINRLRLYKLDEFTLDTIGISISRINALIVQSLIKPYVYGKIFNNIIEASYVFKYKNVNIIVGGFSPGFSTNAVSTLLAYLSDAECLINLTRVGGIYDRDPQKYDNARLLRRVRIDELIKILSKHAEYAGHYPLFDSNSLRMIKEWRIKTYILPPTREALEKLLIHRELIGSEIIV